MLRGSIRSLNPLKMEARNVSPATVAKKVMVTCLDDIIHVHFFIIIYIFAWLTLYIVLCADTSFYTMQPMVSLGKPSNIPYFKYLSGKQTCLLWHSHFTQTLNHCYIPLCRSLLVLIKINALVLLLSISTGNLQSAVYTFTPCDWKGIWNIKNSPVWEIWLEI